MQVIYVIGIKIYGVLLLLLSPFHQKAKKWVSGRRNLLARIAADVDSGKGCIWFHFASLGEFEQGRPVLERLRTLRPEKPLLITFYSPSGYEIRKNTPLADHVFYLPEDTPRNAQRLIELIRPEMAIFTKYEYWPCYFQALHEKQVPLYLISAIFRPSQVFFRWYGSFFRKALHCVTYFFTQNEASLRLLAQLGHRNALLAGDTRFDRVVEIPKQRKQFEEIEAFTRGCKVLVAGSTWPADEALLASLHWQYTEWKLIFAPHEIHEDHIRAIETLFPRSIRYSSLINAVSHQSSDHSPPTADHRSLTTDHRTPNTLIIDNIGMLSSLYGYGNIAYIGGGFGAGIHNTLEAAAYGCPVIFGPNYHKFQEAKDLIALGAGFSINHKDELSAVFETLNSVATREAAGEKAKSYVQANAGATDKILAHLFPNDA